MLKCVSIQGNVVADGEGNRGQAMQSEPEIVTARSLVAQFPSPMSRLDEVVLPRSLYSRILLTMLTRRQMIESYVNFVRDYSPETIDTPFQSEGLQGVYFLSHS